ncbi:ribosomal protein S10p/S20e-domain-containing protein [Obelidium mucronatum]|nr:ribosomal protein S10p/S20e-domain-containing protein [Obelidium mucronatum]
MDTFAIPNGTFNLKPLPIPPIPSNQATLSANMELSSFMPDHADFVAYYARHAAHKRNMPAQQVIHLSTKTKKWHVTRGPFIHDKVKETFEQKTFRRLIQVFNSDQETIKDWYEHVNKNLPPGINMKIETFTPLDLSTLEQQIESLEKQVQEEAKEIRTRLENTLGPDATEKIEAALKSGSTGGSGVSYEQDVRARADAFIKKAMGGGEPAAGGKPKAGKGKK